MRKLFEAYVVDPFADEVIWRTEVPFVAKDHQAAERKVIQKAGTALEKDVDEYDFVVVSLGDVRAKKAL